MAKNAAPVGAKLTPAQLNMMQRQAVLAQSVEMTQQIYSATSAAIPGAPVAVNPRNVGLVKRFIVEVTATVTNNDGAVDATLTDFGLSNLFSNVTFIDLQNNTRINTAGWHLAVLQTLKYRQPFAGGYARMQANATDQYVQAMFGGASVYAPWEVIKGPATILHGTNKAVRAVFEVPLAYSDDDLRGSVYMNVVNATAQLNLTVNPTPFVATGADTTKAVYVGPAAANMTLTNITITVYQVYLDQLPRGDKGVVLPFMDLSTVYELKNTPFTAMAAGVDNPIPYANFRDFLSTVLVYNNDGVTRATGSDINYLALQSANFTNLWKIDPLLAAQFARQVSKVDLPPGTYYFSHRRKPISTLQYGNMELIVNPITAGANMYALVGWEDFALINTLSSAGSLAG